MRTTRLALVITSVMGLSACADLSPTQQRTATGALGGGAIGGVLGSFTGNAGLGALLGAGLGGAGGYLYDQRQQAQAGYGGGYGRRYQGGYGSRDPGGYGRGYDRPRQYSPY
jgi:hypothetical protein